MKTLLLSFLFLTACQQGGPYPPLEVKKGNVLFANRMEGNPIVWHNELLYVISNRMVVGEHIEFYNQNGVRVATASSSYQLINAFVNKDTLYIFGTDLNNILMTSSKDLVNWTPHVAVITAPTGSTVLNSSVSHGPNGFIMAYETCEPNTTCFNARFAQSDDLVNWQPVGTIFKPDVYAACPTIRYSSGYYYVFYLKMINAASFETHVVRSRDLITFEERDAAVLAPNADEGHNNSDFDLVEFNGQVFMQYAVGYQLNGFAPWSDIKSATFNSSMEYFLKSLFN